MDHTNHVRLTGTELTPDILEDATIYGPDDEKIGTVSHTHGVGAATQDCYQHARRISGHRR